jgi:transcriptional regulator with XRE-family HTH domain
LRFHAYMASPRITNGRRIRQAREARGWSQKTLAGKLREHLDGRGFDQTKLSRIENGFRIAPAERLAFLAVLDDLQLLDDDGEDDSSRRGVRTARPREVAALPETYDQDAIAEYLDVDRGLILSAFRARHLRGRKLGRRWFATAAAVTEWLEGPSGPQADQRPQFATVTRKKAS